MMAYVQILDQWLKKKRQHLQSDRLFDFASDEDRQEYEVKLPDVAEYSKEDLLAFEKEVMGIYVSGHPLDDYMNLISKNVTSYTYDFIIDEEQNIPKVEDGSNQTIGGMIVSKSIKTTRTGSTMAFIV